MVPLNGIRQLMLSFTQRIALTGVAFSALLALPTCVIADDASGTVFLEDLTPDDSDSLTSEKTAQVETAPEETVPENSLSEKSVLLKSAPEAISLKPVPKKPAIPKRGNSTSNLWEHHQSSRFSGQVMPGLSSQMPSLTQSVQDDSDSTFDKMVQEIGLEEVSSGRSAPRQMNFGEYSGSGFNSIRLANFQEPPAAPPSTDSSPAANQNPGGNNQGMTSNNNEDSYGTAPEDNTFDFLRTVSPLLKKGQHQFDIGFAYSLYDNDIPGIIDVNPDPDFVVEGRTRLRSMVVPFAYRYGLTDRVQLFVDAPVGWGNAEIAFPGIDFYDDVGGIGDITGGATVLLSEKDPCDPGAPDIVGTLAVSAPTGNAPFSSIVQIPNARLGSGHWGVSGNLLAIKTIDPLVIFYGGGLRYQFARDRGPNNERVEPGLEINYQFGVGFSVNEKVTLSTALLGAYINELEFDNRELPNSSLEPVRIRFALTTINENQRIIEPFVDIGLTDDATNFILGWTCTFQ